MGSNSEREGSSIPAKIQVGSASDIGLVREHNEDALLVQDLVLKEYDPSEVASLYAVADGMGGHSAGEVASNLAIEVLASNVQKALRSVANEGVALRDSDFLSRILVEAVQTANTEIFTQNLSTSRNMGTTLVTMLVVGTAAYLANVGDSRAYLLDGGGLHQLTNDHSLVASLVAAGQIAPEEIYTHPQRNIITRCLGTHRSVQVDTFVTELGLGTSTVLCSDGLWEMVRDDKLRDVLLQSRSPQEACDVLVTLANENGGFDNISVIVAKVEPL